MTRRDCKAVFDLRDVSAVVAFAALGECDTHRFGQPSGRAALLRLRNAGGRFALLVDARAARAITSATACVVSVHLRPLLALVPPEFALRWRRWPMVFETVLAALAADAAVGSS